MTKQLFWEDVDIDTEVNPLSKIATTQMVMKFGAHTGDYNPAHYEDTFANIQGMDRAYVHGQLKRAWLCQLMVEWIGHEGWLKTLGCRFQAPDWPRKMKDMYRPADGETWTCKGKVTKKYVSDKGEHCVDCQIWIENGKGETTTTGSSTVILASRE